MFDRLQKPFLTVETGEAYQPLRITYDILQKETLLEVLNQITCLQKNATHHSWNWYWKAECEDLHFESVDSFKQNPAHPVRLGTLFIKEEKLYVNLPSFKRGCLAIPFFHRLIPEEAARVRQADFVNKVFTTDERLPHGFAELFKDEELDAVLKLRKEEYQRIQEKCENAKTAEEAAAILEEYTLAEAKKRLPYAERYNFEWNEQSDAEIIFLSFYIFLRGRELVAINRWFGQSGYSLVDVADEVIHEVFGSVDIDIIE